jgi:DNA-binding response OmpR family regulator
VRILLADDDAPTLHVLERIVRRAGHEPLLAHDGEEAWAAFQREPVECVVTDWGMPKSNGIELCRAIRAAKDRSWAYVVLLTGRTEKADVLEGIEAGADDFVTKPFNADVLRAKIHAAGRVLGLERRLRDRVADLEVALAEVKTLRGLIPICMYCKKVRDEAEAWQAVEHYVAHHSDAVFSHGVCPTCYEEVVDPMLQSVRDRAGATRTD